MRVNIEFSLPEDKSEYEIAVHGIDFFCIIWGFDQWLREQIKHQDKDYQEIRDKLNYIMEEHAICLDDFA